MDGGQIQKVLDVPLIKLRIIAEMNTDYCGEILQSQIRWNSDSKIPTLIIPLKIIEFP